MPQHDMEALLRNVNGSHLEDPSLGLESMVLEFLLCDRTRRREALYQQITCWQNMDLLDRSSRDGMLQKISEELSRPTRLLARYIACAVAKMVQYQAEGMVNE